MVYIKSTEWFLVTYQYLERLPLGIRVLARIWICDKIAKVRQKDSKWGSHSKKQHKWTLQKESMSSIWSVRDSQSVWSRESQFKMPAVVMRNEDICMTSSRKPDSKKEKWTSHKVNCVYCFKDSLWRKLLQNHQHFSFVRVLLGFRRLKYVCFFICIFCLYCLAANGGCVLRSWSV